MCRRKSVIKEVDTMPWEGEYPARVTAVMLRYGADTLAYTKKFYEVRNVKGELIMGVGVALWNFARPPELWIMLAKPYFTDLRRSLTISRAALHLPAYDYPGLVCDVKNGNKVEEHFVRSHGFRPTGQPSLRPNGAAYTQYGVH
jgi:hypothetical protein